jgi:hypothetical protein
MMLERTPMSKLLHRGTLAALALAMAAGLGPARADLYVLESTTPEIRAGSHLATGDQVLIANGSFIRAVLPSGKTQTIRGPFNGPVGDLDRGQARNEGVIDWLKSILATGGSREVTPGATRGIRREPPAASMAFSWSAVPATVDAGVCLIKGGGIELVRGAAPRAERASIVESVSGARGEVQWEAGSAVAAWPAGLTPNADATYYVFLPGHPQRQLTLHLIDKKPGDDEVLVVLQRLGCRQQFEAWVREKLASAKPH